MLLVKTDGSFVGSPVNAGVGAFVIFEKNRRVHEEAARDERVSTSTVAEALAIVKALLWLESKGLNKETVVVATDSRSTLDVVRGKVKTRSTMLKEFCDWIIAASRNFTDLTYLNCHRGEVSEAQMLARIALRPERATVKGVARGEAPMLPPPPAPRSGPAPIPGVAAQPSPAPAGRGRRRGSRGGRGRRQGGGLAPVAAPVAATANGTPPPPPVSRAPRPRPVPPPAGRSTPPAPKAAPAAPAKPAGLSFLQQAILKKKK